MNRLSEPLEFCIRTARGDILSLGDLDPLLAHKALVYRQLRSWGLDLAEVQYLASDAANVLVAPEQWKLVAETASKRRPLRSWPSWRPACLAEAWWKGAKIAPPAVWIVVTLMLSP